MAQKSKQINVLVLPLLVLVGVISLLTIEEASAHELIAVRPDNTMFQQSLFFPNSDIESHFTLEEFEREGQSHWYRFNGIKDQQVLIQILVPNIESTRNFSPCFDLIIGEDKVTPESERTEFIEDISNTDWLITCKVRMNLPDDGVYFIRAHDELFHYEVGDTGKFSMAFGTSEDLSIVDWLYIPIWILQANLFFENLVYVWIMLVLILVAVILVIYYLNKRGKN